MAACETCGATILFGGVDQDGMRYCNAACAQKGALIQSAGRVSDAEVETQARAIHQGNCPRCGGPGPVDVHRSHTVYSFLVMTRWVTSPTLCCRSCGRKKQLGAAGASFLLGWWGFPWGLIMTPVQLARNAKGLLGGGPDPSTPSADLRKLVRVGIVSRHDAEIAAAAANQARSGPTTSP